MSRDQFLQMVRTHIEADPEAAPHVAGYVQAGLNAALTQAYERAADMECALAALAAKRYKGADALVLDKLRKWQGKTALRWDWLLTPNAALTGAEGVRVEGTVMQQTED
mgnify:CR=1 FL=1